PCVEGGAHRAGHQGPGSGRRGGGHRHRRHGRRHDEVQRALAAAKSVARGANSGPRVTNFGVHAPRRRYADRPLVSPLAALPPLLRDEPALRHVAGRHAALLAVPEAARALTVAALAHLSDRRPVVVAVPTGTAAEQLADDLAQYLDPDAVALFPAW